MPGCHHLKPLFPAHLHLRARAGGDINWDGLGLCTALRLSGTNFYGNRGPARQLRVRQAISQGVPTRYGYSSVQPAAVERPDSTHGPWISGFDRIIVSKELTQLRNAAYIFVAIMTMMRDSEVQSLATGAIGTHYGAPPSPAHCTRCSHTVEHLNAGGSVNPS